MVARSPAWWSFYPNSSWLWLQGTWKRKRNWGNALFIISFKMKQETFSPLPIRMEAENLLEDFENFKLKSGLGSILWGTGVVIL